MSVADKYRFDRPVPGQGLTQQPGNSRPWKSPPSNATVTDALAMYMPLMATPDFIDAVTNMADSGIPIPDIAETFMTMGVLKGEHTIDVGFLVSPVIVEMMILICEQSGVEPLMVHKKDDDADIPETVISSAMRSLRRKAKERFNAPAYDDLEDEVGTEEEAVMEDTLEAVGGLMSRRT